LKKPTLDDIARVANVSISTVSLVLANKGRISDEVRSRVLAVADDLNYFKEPRQTNGRSHDSETVGILYSFDTHWAHAHRLLAPLVVAVDETLKEHGYYMSLVTFTRGMSAQELYDRIAHCRLSGLISVNFANKTLFSRLEKAGVPVVLANNLEYQDLFYTAGVDDFQGTYEAANYLLSLGHRRIAYFDYPTGTFHPLANRRYYGYRAALEEAGVTANDDYRVIVDVHDFDALLKQIDTLLKLPEPPTAFMSDDDNIMMSVWHAAEQLGAKIPEDVSAIANGDTQDYDRVDTPRLTTMRINTAQLGKFAAEMLVNRLNDELEEVQVVKLKEQLVERGSCREVMAVAESVGG